MDETKALLNRIIDLNNRNIAKIHEVIEIEEMVDRTQRDTERNIRIAIVLCGVTTAINIFATIVIFINR